MARRTTQATNGRKTRQSGMPAGTPAPVVEPAPRRGRKPTPSESLEATTALADPAVSGGNAPASVSAGPEEPPAKPSRGRKAKELAAAPAPSASEAEAAAHFADVEPADPIPTPEPPAKPRRGGRKPKPAPDAASIEPEPSPPVAAPDDGAPAVAAAHWDAATGTVTFDWPAIEQVAAQGGPNQAMAKLLLAARAEGANSRWPF